MRFRRLLRFGRGGAASQPILDPGNLLIVQERERLLARLLRKAGYRTLAEVRVFEAGSGGGYNLRQCVQWGANPADLAGIDIDGPSVDYSRAHSPNIRVHLGSAESIPEVDRSFDVCLAFTLFSSIHDEDIAERIAAEMFRVTRPGGLIVVYDMRRDNPRNPAVHAVDSDDIRRWFPKCRAKTKHITLVPPLARPLARWTPFLYGPLALVPPLRTHSVHVLRRPATSSLGEESWATSVHEGEAT
jgi:SAM-dependent methyltransferase